MKATVMLVSSLISLIMILPALSLPVSADGFSYVRPSPQEQWGPLKEVGQYAMISHDGKIQKMILSISIKNTDLLNSQGLVWIFPIPSAAIDARIEVLSNVTQFDGGAASDSINRSLAGDYSLIYGSQLFLLPFSYALTVDIKPDPYYPYGGYLGFGSTGSAGKGSNEPAVDIVEHIESHGLTTELISAEDNQAIYEYLTDVGLTPTAGLLEALDGYNSSEYSFVISWVNNPNEILSGPHQYDYQQGYNYYSIGIYVEFPCQMIYFPMKLTSMYGHDVKIPIVLQITGFVGAPEADEMMLDSLGAKEKYFVQDGYEFDTDLSDFFFDVYSQSEIADGKLQTLKYTEIRMDGYADYMTDDIWVPLNPPLKEMSMSFLVDNHFIFTIFILAIASMLASLIGAMIVYREQSPEKARFAILGLANLATIVGLVIAAYKLKINSRFVQDESGEATEKGIGIYLFSFIMLFVLFASVSQAFVALALGL